MFGRGTNTKDELLALWCLFLVAKMMDIDSMKNFGDFMMIINWARNICIAVSALRIFLAYSMSFPLIIITRSKILMQIYYLKKFCKVRKALFMWRNFLLTQNIFLRL